MRAEHCLVVGHSDVGKTPLLRQVHDEVNGPSIVCNHRGQEKWVGRIVGTLEGAQTAIGEYNRWEDIRLNYRNKNKGPVEMAWDCISISRGIYRQAGVPCQVVIDESGAIMSKSMYEGREENPVGWGLHEGKNNGIKMAIATQDPMEWPTTPIKQARWWTWIGAPAGPQEAWLNHSVAQWIPEDRLPDARFRYVVLHSYKGGSGNDPVVYRGRTLKKYGT